MVAGVESGVYRLMATIAVVDVETDLQVIVVVVVALSFRSRALRVGVVEVLEADLDEADVVVL